MSHLSVRLLPHRRAWSGPDLAPQTGAALRCEDHKMATTYPYISSSGPVVKTVERFRKQFPGEVTAETLRKLGIAPKNESYVINILKFLKLIDENGKKVDVNAKAFLLDDAAFAAEFGKIVKTAYSSLFDLYGDDSWASQRDELITYFRTSDGSSDVVGHGQAITFVALAALSGHGEITQPRPVAPAAKKPVAAAATKPKPASTVIPPSATLPPPEQAQSRVGLTVRIEVNLPANGDQKTYDAIFQSIRKNLIDSE